MIVLDAHLRVRRGAAHMLLARRILRVTVARVLAPIDAELVEGHLDRHPWILDGGGWHVEVGLEAWSSVVWARTRTRDILRAELDFVARVRRR